ncbi:pentapeptide repeat-containing protein [Nonomuraea wenchangensis]|uniref:pentapeptide repeat-containing protein n=1 Tax=Nonomuraea wenchangensis TaxID=568860 RepID=UPI0033275F0F
MEKRQELHDARRQRQWQHLTSLGVLLGLVFTAGGLVYTARTWETGQKTLDSAVQGQVTDRYTKAVEQLGSAKPDVRLGGIYALQRLATDSPRDQETIRNVLAAFVRNHDLCKTDQKSLPKQCTTTKTSDFKKLSYLRPGADVRAALTIAAALSSENGGAILNGADFSQIQFPGADLILVKLPRTNLASVQLQGAALIGADLQHSYLGGARLGGAQMSGAQLSEALLSFADLEEADLAGARLRGSDIHSSNLRGTNLTSAILDYADLSDADLRGANLNGASLRNADLRGTDLRGTNLKLVVGKTRDEMQRVAIVDNTTLF